MSSVSLRTETNNYYRKCPPIVVCYVQQEDDTAAPLSLLKYIQRKLRSRALFHKQIVNLMQFPQCEVLRCHCTGLLSSWFKLNRMFILWVKEDWKWSVGWIGKYEKQTKTTAKQLLKHMPGEACCLPDTPLAFSKMIDIRLHDKKIIYFQY